MITILLFLSIGDYDIEKSITIDIKDYDSYQIQRLINSAYISNYREIKLVGKSTIYIYSNFAQYDKNNFDTKFYQNVLVHFEDKRFNCDNLDLFFKDNFGSMYNNIVFVDENTQINADQVNMNLLNGDINIKMFKEEKKIKILKK